MLKVKNVRKKVKAIILQMENLKNALIIAKFAKTKKNANNVILIIISELTAKNVFRKLVIAKNEAMMTQNNALLAKQDIILKI